MIASANVAAREPCTGTLRIAELRRLVVLVVIVEALEHFMTTVKGGRAHAQSTDSQDKMGNEMQIQHPYQNNHSQLLAKKMSSACACCDDHWRHDASTHTLHTQTHREHWPLDVWHVPLHVIIHVICILGNSQRHRRVALSTELGGENDEQHPVAFITLSTTWAQQKIYIFPVGKKHIQMKRYENIFPAKEIQVWREILGNLIWTHEHCCQLSSKRFMVEGQTFCV